jgi:hypothetical protein
MSGGYRLYYSNLKMNLKILLENAFPQARAHVHQLTDYLTCIRAGQGTHPTLTCLQGIQSSSTMLTNFGTRHTRYTYVPR